MTTGQPKHRQTLAWVLFTAVFFLPGVLFGEDVITMGYGSGSPGDTGVDVVITATNDTSIHGYSVAFTYPTNVLSLTSVSTTGTHIDAAC